jgi:hypothetical protein
VRPNDEGSESWGESWGESCASRRARHDGDGPSATCAVNVVHVSEGLSEPISNTSPRTRLSACQASSFPSHASLSPMPW